MEYLLDDLTVIDAATFLAGPGAATILGDCDRHLGPSGYRAEQRRHCLQDAFC